MPLENVRPVGFDSVAFTERDTQGFARSLTLSRAEILKLLEASTEGRAGVIRADRMARLTMPSQIVFLKGSEL